MVMVMLTGCTIVYNSGSKSGGAAVTKTLSTESFTSIKTKIGISDLKIKEGNDYKVVYHGHKNIIPTVKVNNGELTINQKNTSVSFSGADKVIIIVPKKLKNINIQTDEGDIKIGELTALSGQIESSEGNIDVN